MSTLSGYVSIKKNGMKEEWARIQLLDQGEHKAKVVLEQQGMEGMHF